MPIRRHPTARPRPRRRPLLAAALLLAVMAGLSACGQKGPLRLPGEEPAPEPIQGP